MACSWRRSIGTPDRHPRRHLSRRVRQPRLARAGDALHQRHPAVRAVDRASASSSTTGLCRAGRPLLRLGRRVRAGADRDTGGRAHHREHAAARARQPARGGGRARRADVEGDPDGHAARGRAPASSPASCSPSRASPARRRRCCSPRSTTSSGAPNMNAPMANLPVVIFQFAMSPYEDWQDARLGRRAAHHADRARASTSSRASLFRGRPRRR